MSDASGGGATQTPAGGAAPTTTPSAGPSSPPAQTVDHAEFARLKADHEKLLSEIHEKKRKAKEAESAAARAAEEQGQYKEALEVAKKRLAELEDAAPLAEKWRTFESESLAQIEARKATLPEQVRAALDRVSGLDAKRAVLEVFDAAAGTAPRQPSAVPSAGGGAPPPGAAIDFDAAWNSGSSAWNEAEKRDPAGAAAFKAAMTGQSKTPSFQRGIYGKAP